MSSSYFSSSPPSANPNQTNDDYSSQPSKLPLREIPGSYGSKFFGAIKDRRDYFYNQGEVDFFKTRMEKYKSTVFRCNMPPGPFISSDPRVVALLDAASFPILFDNSRVEKTNVLDGTYMPSLDLTGGYRMCAYLDTAEPEHAALKGLFLTLLGRWHKDFVPTFRSSMSDLFIKLEDQLADKKGKAAFNSLSDEMSFDFVFRLFTGKHPSDINIGSKGPSLVDTWLAFQLSPLVALGLKFVPDFLEDLVLHTFPLPPFLAKSGYKKLYDGFYNAGGSILDEAEKLGIKRDVACHNLVFLAGFNAYGGMKAQFPALIKWVATAGIDLHRRLAEEIRGVVKEEGGITLSALNKMSLTKSVVYESLRIEPPVPYQYAKAREDITIQSHDSSFLIKKGEMIFGYQPFAMKDPKVFVDRPEEFVADRFVGEEGEKLIKYVYWSNERETVNPTVDNKQCPAKDLVVLLCRLMVVEFFLRYDTFEVEIGKASGLGSSVTFKSLTKAT